MPLKDDPANENKYFDRRFCGKVIRIGAVACATVLASDVVFLVLVDPSHSRCVGWAIPRQNGDSSIWGLVAIVGLFTASIAYWAINWDSAARRIVERLERTERLAESDTSIGWKWALANFRVHRARARMYHTHMIDFGSLLISIMIGCVFFCAAPLLIVTGC